MVSVGQSGAFGEQVVETRGVASLLSLMDNSKVALGACDLQIVLRLSSCFCEPFSLR